MNPPPSCVPIHKTKLNFSLKQGMWPVAEMVPHAGQKISPHPAPSERYWGSWPWSFSRISLITGSYLMCQESPAQPQESTAGDNVLPDYTAAPWGQRQAATWKIVNSLSSPPMATQGLPIEQAAVKEKQWLWCLVLASQGNHFSGEQKGIAFCLQLAGPDPKVVARLTSFLNSQNICLMSPHLSWAQNSHPK